MISESINNRRSIRKYKSDSVSRDMIEEIIKAGINAPSAKNRQPWRFVIVMDNEKESMIHAMSKGIQNESVNGMVLPNSKQYISGAKESLKIMEQAPVTIFILNPRGASPFDNIGSEDRFYEMANTMSIGAAIQNMSLAAVEKGLGSLWICDIFFAYNEICEWLNTDDQLVAALSIGYPDENPSARPRKSIDEITEWRY